MVSRQKIIFVILLNLSQKILIIKKNVLTLHREIKTQCNMKSKKTNRSNKQNRTNRSNSTQKCNNTNKTIIF